jgi:hypothetical protein
MLEKPVNPNYCATVVRISKINTLDNCDNVVAAIIFGNSVIVGKDTKIGDFGLYFPPETQLSKDFLYHNNLYRKAELNADVTKKGYFEENRRIKVAKFRGHKSEGLFMPASCLKYITASDTFEGDFQYLSEGVDFDKIGKNEICRKYIIRARNEPGQQKKSDKKVVKKFDRLVENQFRLHIDTENLRRNSYKLRPDDLISITNKIHGTSWVVGRVMVKKPSWINNLGFKLADINFPTVLNFLKYAQTGLINKMLGHDSGKTQYDTVYSSRTVVKNKYINTTVNSGFYNFDLWGEIADSLKDSLMDGITLYGEAVGYLPTGAWIQKGYHYGTRPNHYDVYVYRITYTNPQGKLIEFSWPQIKEYCNKFGLKHVQEFYYGPARDKYPLIKETEHWNQNFLEALEAEYMLDRKCPLNNEEVWEEGIVVRVDGLFECSPYKLKNFAFLDKERKDNDEGVVDLESAESLPEEEEDATTEA